VQKQELKSEDDATLSTSPV